ncbi:MAG: TldD/PmbA family protein [Myxococcota bacterium]
MKNYIPRFDEGLEGELKSLVFALKSKGAEFAEARFVSARRELFNSRSGELSRPYLNLSRGVGIRVLASGAWGFSATDNLTSESLVKTGLKAMEVAQAAARVNSQKVVLPERPPSVGEYGTAYEKDPFALSQDEKFGLITNWDEALNRKEFVKVSRATLGCQRLEKLYAASDGSLVKQGFFFLSAGVQATAVSDGEVFIRSFPADYYANRQAGFEFIESLEMDAAIEKLHSELEELVKAPPTPTGKKDLILTGPQLALQIHESCGHPTELDRVLGEELSLAGSSFLVLERFKSGYRYGSEKVNLVADSTVAGGMGTFGWDDEGTPASFQYLVKEGRLAGYLSSRETAYRTGAPLHGSVRADEWSSFPIIRMTNVNLMPGDDGSLEDLISDTKDGLLIDVNRSWSIDDKRLNFQFGGELAWEIKNGKKTRILKNPLYTGITPEFWRGMDAVCGESEWSLHGVPHCGKGDPIQIMMVGHGCAPARFKNVEVTERK